MSFHQRKDQAYNRNLVPQVIKYVEMEVSSMPGGDGTGPRGKGFGGRGRMGGNRAGAGPGGQCVCPQCGTKVSHQVGTPCSSASCPQCGTRMMRA